MANEKITLNGKEITKEELDKIKEQANMNKDIKLQEVSKNVYIQRIQG